MTLIGKLLAFLNLVVGLGIVTWATTEYALRPGWFEPVPERVEKGSDPVNFAMLKQDVDALGKAIDVASGEWGRNLAQLEAMEKVRDFRGAEFAKRAKWIREGNPDQGDAGFFQPVYEKDLAGKDTSLLKVYDVNADGTVTTFVGPPVKGPDDKPLKGIAKLGTDLTNDVSEVARLAAQVATARKEQAELSKQILAEDKRLEAMIAVRDNVQSELFFLGTFELNVYETRTTVFNRKRQLAQRLAELGGVPAVKQ